MSEEATMTEKSRNSTHERRYDWIGQKYYITRIEVGNIRSMSQVIMSDFGFIILHPALHQPPQVGRSQVPPFQGHSCGMSTLEARR